MGVRPKQERIDRKNKQIKTRVANSNRKARERVRREARVVAKAERLAAKENA